MLALQKTKPGEGLALVEVGDPDLPGPGEVLIEVVATGICGSDLSIEHWSGSYSSFMSRRLPVTLGHETVGRVVAVGEGVSKPEIGTTVVVNPAVACGRCEACRGDDPGGCTDRQAIGMVRNGAFARYFVAPAAYCYTLPDNVPVELGALAEPLSVGVHALVTGDMKPGHRVVVFGPGPIGQGAAAVARYMGAREVVVVGLDDAPRLSVLRQMGFDRLIDMAEPGARAELTALAGEGFDLALDATGSPAVINQALGVLRPKGILTLAGMGEEEARVDVLRVVRNRLQIRGVSRIPASAWDIVLEAMAADPDCFAKLISHRFPLAEAATAFDLCRRRQASKVLLLPPH